MHKSIDIAPNLPVYHTYPDGNGKHPGLILIHEIWGLGEHIKDVSNRFAAEGYSVLAPDLFADVKFEGTIDQTILAEMQNPETRDAAQQKMRTITAPVRTPEFGEKAVEKLEHCFAHLQKDAGVSGGIGITGFCFGGTYSFALACAEPELACAVPFYGHPPAEEKIRDISCPILAFYGDMDQPLMESLPALKEEMAAQGKEFEAVVYPGARHAFFNDTNPATYNEAAAKDAWPKALAFLEKNLKRG